MLNTVYRNLGNCTSYLPLVTQVLKLENLVYCKFSEIFRRLKEIVLKKLFKNKINISRAVISSYLKTRLTFLYCVI